MQLVVFVLGALVIVWFNTRGSAEKLELVDCVEEEVVEVVLLGKADWETDPVEFVTTVFAVLVDKMETVIELEELELVCVDKSELVVSSAPSKAWWEVELIEDCELRELAELVPEVIVTRGVARVDGILFEVVAKDDVDDEEDVDKVDNVEELW